MMDLTMNTTLQEALAQLYQLQKEEESSKKLKEKADKVITILLGNSDVALDKAIFELEDLGNIDMSSYCRTRVWDVISLLESAKQ